MKSFTDQLVADAFLYDSTGRPVYAPFGRKRALYDVVERDRARIGRALAALWFAIFVAVYTIDDESLGWSDMVVTSLVLAGIVGIAGLLINAWLCRSMAPAEANPDTLRSWRQVHGRWTVHGPVAFAFSVGSLASIAMVIATGLRQLVRPDHDWQLALGVGTALTLFSLLGERIARSRRGAPTPTSDSARGSA